MSSSSSHVGEASSSRGNGNGDGNGNGNGTSRSRRRRRRRPPTPPPPPPPSHEEPSTSRYDINGGVWPEPFVEALVLQVALDASLSLGRLAAAPALATLFQVCATWRTVSRSELLWQNLVRVVWNRTNLLHHTWRDEFMHRHRTAHNFRVCRCSYVVLRPSDHPPAAVAGRDEAAAGDVDQLPLFCIRLALSDNHLAAGFSDGSIRLFHLPSRFHLRTIRPLFHDHLGLFSRAVSGIALLPSIDRLVFASLDGDVHVAAPLAEPGPARRAYFGDVVNDGALVDFVGCMQFWIGLYAGVPGRTIRVWDAESEELVFVGGSLTDPESVMGWHMLTELRLTELLGRVRIAAHGLAIGVTGRRVLVMDLEAQGAVVREEGIRRGVIVGSVDTHNDVFIMVDARGVASVRHARTLQEVCRLDRSPLRGVPLRGLLGCINNLYVVMCIGGVVRVWGAEHGEYLYSLQERIGEATALAASDQHVAASNGDTTIHLWDFGV